jgi:hypothetical protein
MTTVRSVEAFIETCQHLSREATGQILRVQLGGRVVAIEGCCEGVIGSLRHQWSHLEVPADTPATSQIAIVDARHQPLVPRIAWDWEATYYQDAGGFAAFSPYPNALYACYHDRSKMALVSRSHQPEAFLFREITRLVFQPIFAQLEIGTFHGGTLGIGDRGVLLVGRGGSGKSTLVSWGVTQGMTTLGDDFLLVPLSEPAPDEFTLGSLFWSAKLEPRSPASDFFPNSSPHIGEKRTVDLRHGAESLTMSQNISAVVSVRVSSKTRLSDATEGDILEALLPHSVPLNDNPSQLVATAENRLKRVPLYLLGSGPDMAETLEVVHQLVAR